MDNGPTVDNDMTSVPWVALWNGEFAPLKRVRVVAAAVLGGALVLFAIQALVQLTIVS